MVGRYALPVPRPSRLLPALLALGGPALADPNAPLTFRMHPEEYHAYQNDPPPPLTLTLTLRNPTARAVPLKCLSVGGPVLRRFTEVQDGQAVHRDEALGELKPQGNAPVCRTVGQVITVPAGGAYTYARTLGPQKPGAQVHYRAGWNVRMRPGSGWLQHAYISALVVPQDRPVATPNPQAYQRALVASRARWYTRTSISAPADHRLAFGLADELSRQVFLAELKKRGLDASNIDLEVAPPVQFRSRPPFAHSAEVAVTRTTKGYTFTLTVTNNSSAPVGGGASSACEPLVIERLTDGLRVRQEGNGPCISLGMPAVTLRPGQSNAREAHWDGNDSLGQRVPPGQYRVKMALGQFVGEAVFTVR